MYKACISFVKCIPIDSLVLRLFLLYMLDALQNLDGLLWGVFKKQAPCQGSRVSLGTGDLGGWEVVDAISQLTRG